ncbi:SDR family NAD(P)-dependent oxidoreductase [Aquimarina sp. ERC-38]|uniref:SDR family NAD(P)-dependent oxidoreductase n=1 Tax=Aquimarina sp. ERC-38 TaxID=2949996 RepID=UPI002245C5A7|nr:SDR family NAD(P)-dependent oxidoreductase [Aquimarina sp. ERC-38]UZO82008.1 SDR family NAD(P)-dependent oxidoreductase [Aquimarina sp. ERC-38]
MSTIKTALITGATSGIGRATAIAFAEQNINLIICGRRKERLLELQYQLQEKVEVHTLSFDVRDKKAVFSEIGSLPGKYRQIDILVNNAGNAHGLDSLQEGSIEDWDAMMDINVKGLLYVSKAVTPGMIARKSGFVINVGSTAAKEVYPKGNVYCASKHAVDAITQGMRIDFNPYGIRVGAIHPGLVETEFSNVRFKGDKDRADQTYKGFEPLHSEDIADAIVFMITRPPHVTIGDMVIVPTAQATTTIVHKELYY